MQIAFIAKLVVKPEQAAELEQLQKELSDITHDTEPDTLVYDFIRHRDQANTYVVYARFKDEAAFQAHLEAPHFAVFKEAADKWRVDGIQGSARGSKNLWPTDAEWR